MAQFGGLQGLGGPIDYFGMATAPATQMLNDSYRNDALEANTMAQRQQTQQAHDDQIRRQSFYDAIGSATPDQLPALRRQFPEFAQNIQQEIGIQSAEHASFVHGALNDLSVAAASGNPQAVQSAIQKNGPALSSLGVSQEQAAQLYQQDPQQFNSLLNATRLATLPMDKQFETQQNQQKIDETARSNRAGEAVQWANNNIAQQNVNLRRMELDDKKFDRQIANETNVIRLADLQDKRQQNQQAIEQAKRDKADAYNAGVDTLSRTIDTATKVLNSPGFTGYFGTNLNPLSSRHIPGTDAADTEALVDTLKSQGFMSGIQQMKGMGALSNAEGQKVMDAIGNLSASQSEKSARAAINTIISTTQRAQQRMQQKYGKDIQTQSSSQPQEQPSAAQLQPGHSEGGYTFLGGDPAKPTSWRKN